MTQIIWPSAGLSGALLNARLGYPGRITVLVSENGSIVLLRRRLLGAELWGQTQGSEARSGLIASPCHLLPPAGTHMSLVHGRSPGPSPMVKLCEAHGQVHMQGSRGPEKGRPGCWELVPCQTHTWRFPRLPWPVPITNSLCNALICLWGFGRKTIRLSLLLLFWLETPAAII